MLHTYTTRQPKNILTHLLGEVQARNLELASATIYSLKRSEKDSDSLPLPLQDNTAWRNKSMPSRKDPRPLILKISN